jgi:hypothetical protein
LPIASWTCPLPHGGSSEELVVSFDRQRSHRVLVIPALFDEANKLRRQTLQVMRRLDLAGIDSCLPDLPAMNESLEPQSEQTLAGWRDAVIAAAQHFGATHVLSWRGGAVLAPTTLPGWHYAPQSGAKQLRSMLRARTISAREVGCEETLAQLQELGRQGGLELAGWQLGAAMFAALETAEPPASDRQVEISQAQVGGAGLWLRAEPDEDAAQADVLASIIATSLGIA